MKNRAKIISLLLAVLMVLSSFCAVFAEAEAGTPEATDSQQESAEEVPTVDASAEDQTVDAAPATDDAAPSADQTDPSADQADPSADGQTQDVTAEEPAPGEGTDEEGNNEEDPPVVPATVNVTVNYVFADGSQAAEPVTGEYEVGAVIASPEVPGYKPDKEQVEVTVPEDPAATFEVTVTYEAAATEAVSDLALHPSYESIILKWSKVEGADHYLVYRSTKKDSGFKKIATVTSTKDTIKYTDKKANGVDKEFSRALKYYYKVYTVSVSGVKSKASKKVNGTCVRPMYETVTFKASAQLTSHDGKNKTRTFYGGQTIVAQGFGGGKYRFWYKGNYFYANYVRVYKCKPNFQKNTDNIVGKATKYTGKWAKQNYASQKGKEDSTEYKGIKYYSRTTAENFVNKSKKSSKTKYLIWVSTYTQHIYVFKGKKGKWKLVKDWECSTGSAGSPTPTGFDKKIVDKWYTHSGIKYWNPFQHINSIHGQRKSYRFGKPQSNGCVRNYDDNAKWIYYTCKKGTGLIVY